MAAVFSCSAGVVAGFPYLRTFPVWLEFEKKRVSGGAGVEEVLRRVVETAPEFRLNRALARESLLDALETGERADFDIALADYEEVLARNSWDGESLANKARILDELGRFEEAEEVHRAAIEAIGRRENKYGVIFGFGYHFIRRALEAESSREPSRALANFMLARQCVVESRRRNFEKGDEARETLRWLDQKIKFLRGARVMPLEVKILGFSELLRD